MKYAMPLGAVLLIGIGVCVHQSPGVLVVQERRARVLPVAVAPEALPASAEVSRVAISQAVTVSTTQPRKAGEGTSSTSAAGRSPAPAWRRMTAALESGLTLTEVQKPEVELILRHRDEEIKEGHDSIRRAGVLDFRAYEWEIGLLKAAWFRRIDALLDKAQHEKFVAMVEQGFFNEGLAFTIEPGITILD